MVLKQFQKSFDAADLLPPSILFEDGEDSSQGISTIGATSSIGGESSILDDHEDSACVIENDIQILDWNNGLLDIFEGKVYFLSDIAPHFFYVIHLINIKHARIWTQLFPNFVSERNFGFLLKEG